MFPVIGINVLEKGAECNEGVGFADIGNLILDLGQKSGVELLMECGISPLDTGS